MDRFREIINENPELTACREELEEAGFGMDLATLSMGNGKLLVRGSLAMRTIAALQKRAHITGSLLTSSDLVVSQELKATVLEQIQRLAPRTNRVCWTEALDLSPSIRSRRTFLDDGVASSSSIPITCSSTDAHIGPHSNPRVRSGQAA